MSLKHKATASDLWDIRESYFSLLTDINSGLISKEDIASKRDDLQEKLHAVYEASPRSIPKAYGKAQEALKLSEELTFSDEEIDKFLPAPLRKRA